MKKGNLNVNTWLIGCVILGISFLVLWDLMGNEQETGINTVVSKTEWKGGSQPTAERAISAAIEAEKDRLEFEKNNNLGV